MPTTPSYSRLNATTPAIINGIRATLPASAQAQIPVVHGVEDIEKVGYSLSGNAGLMNDFANALMNQLALVLIKSATFYNRFREMKKGTIEYGNTVEEIWVDLVKAIEYNADLGPERELARTKPEILAQFHVINWRVIYPITIDDVELTRAFQTESGLRDLIERLISMLHTSAEVDDMLLTKYLVIKAVTRGDIASVAVDSADTKSLAKTARATATRMTYPSAAYNRAGVTTATAPEDLVLIIDADTAAEYDVETLSAAFNISKAEVPYRTIIVDSWTEFDNDRFSKVDAEFVEDVTAEELAAMSGVRAVAMDANWFQLYDKPIQLRDTQVGSGLYRNYWLHVWKIVSSSPYHNAVVYQDAADVVEAPETLTVDVTGLDTADGTAVFTLDYREPVAPGLGSLRLVQTEDASTAGVLVIPNGGVVLPQGVDTSPELVARLGDVEYGAPAITRTTQVGAELTFTKGGAPDEPAG